MKEFFLVVMFYLSPDPTFVEGFLPLGFDTAEECEARRKTAQEYFALQGFPESEMYCFKRTPHGSNT